MKKLLVSQGWDEDKIDEHIKMILNKDVEAAEIDDLDKLVLAYARKLTVDPSSITKADVDEIKSYGASDLAIHDLCSIVAYFNFVNRIADGLGVELE